MILFTSSIIMGCIHVYWLYYALLLLVPEISNTSLYPVMKQWVLLNIAAIVTSIWNHGTTSLISKWTDRIVVTYAIYKDYVMIQLLFRDNVDKIPCIIILITSISCFIVSKLYHTLSFYRFLCHILSHIIATLLHIVIIEESIWKLRYYE